MSHSRNFKDKRSKIYLNGNNADNEDSDIVSFLSETFTSLWERVFILKSFFTNLNAKKIVNMSLILLPINMGFKLST